MEQEELARRSGVSVTTIRRLEAAGGECLVAEGTTATVRKALEEAGVEFIHQGVSLKPAARDAEALLERLRRHRQTRSSGQRGPRMADRCRSLRR